VAGLLVLATATIYAYQTTRLTLAKSEAVNAADAAAYSAAVEGARHMNFIAYTNRAMVANAIAGGMMTTYSSWAKNMADVVGYFDQGVKGFFKQIAKIGEDKAQKTACANRDASEYEEYADDGRSGSIDEDGNVSGGDQTHGGGRCDGADTRAGGAGDPWGRRNKGPVSGYLNVVAEAIGYMSIPVDLLNGLYAASQWAVWGTANSDMEKIAAEVAKSHDGAYSVEVNYPDASLMADGFFSWVLPKRPGVDKMPEVQVPSIEASGVGAFLTRIPALGGLISADMRNASQVNPGLMRNYIKSATTGNDAFYIHFSRDWRLCALAGPVCAPTPLNNAIEHSAFTTIEAGTAANPSAWKSNVSGRDSADGWQGSSIHDVLERLPGMRSDRGDRVEGEWRRVANFSLGPNAVKEGTGLGLQRMLGKTGGVQALTDQMSNTDAANAYHFGEIASSLAQDGVGAATGGMNWRAGDYLRQGVFTLDGLTSKHFFDGAAGGLVPFFAFGNMCFLDNCFTAGNSFGEGQTSIVDHHYPMYQGVWSYFTIPSAPQLGIGKPEMWIEVTVSKTSEGGPLAGLPDDFLGLDLSGEAVTVEHSARAELFYHRQPNSPYAPDVGSKAGQCADNTVSFLPSANDCGNRPRFFSQPEDNQTASTMGLRRWSSGQNTSYDKIGDGDVYSDGSYGLLENWFGKSLTWTFASVIQRQTTPRDQGEYANAFAPFWQARLIDDRGES
jgi:hypothetical protein